MIRPIHHPYFEDGEAVQSSAEGLPGPFAVGLCHYHVVDSMRRDEQDGGPRQFMVAAFFPAEANERDVHARFSDIFEPIVGEALAYVTEGLETDIAKKLSSKLRSLGLRAIRHGAPRRSAAPYPVLIDHPGGGNNRFASVDVCEALASQGYVVLSVDGPHDAPLVVFPDGHLCKGPLVGDYISPGVGDVGALINHLENLNGEGPLAGMLDTSQLGIYGHSRGGYIANVSAFMYERLKGAVSIDSFLWGYLSEGTGLEKHPPEFQAKVKSMPKPMLRLCGRPAGTDPQEEAEFCLKRDGGDFIGSFSVVAFPGWMHVEFATTPWLCGKNAELVANQSRTRMGAGETLASILAAFFDIQLCGADNGQLKECIRRVPGLGLAEKS